jgi:2'-5' RNA ligase
MPTLRLFIALETPPEIKPKIAAIRDQLRTSNADVKWEPGEKLHATMKFLGNTSRTCYLISFLILRGLVLRLHLN